MVGMQVSSRLSAQNICSATYHYLLGANGGPGVSRYGNGDKEDKQCMHRQILIQILIQKLDNFAAIMWWFSKINASS